MTKRNLTKFGIEIKKRLIEKGMTQSQLAFRIGTSNVYLTNIMYGKLPLIRSKVAKRILEELDLNSDLILNNEIIQTKYK